MTRKGAIATYLEPWHNDIEDFIDLKKNSGEERRRAHDIFPALWITDVFMERVLEDREWTLFDPHVVSDLAVLYGEEFKVRYEYYEKELVGTDRCRVVKAKDLWKKILTSYYESGSPFLCFKDTANVANPNKHVGLIRSSNLCTEIFQNTEPNHYLVKISLGNDDDYIKVEEEDLVYLSDGTYKLGKKVSSLDTLQSGIYTGEISKQLLVKDKCKVYCIEKEKVDGKTAVCNLASVNLSRINTKQDMERVIPIAVNMLDNVIDLNFYPLKKVKKTNMTSRSIGCGVMGEAEMLASKQVLFGTQQHFDLIDEIMECFSYNVIKASSDLGKEKGNYPDFIGSNWNNGIMTYDFARESVEELTTSSSKTNIYTEQEWNELRESCSNHMRNGYLMAIAPTSSISILVGTTQAIEPIYKKKWFEENLSGLIPVVAPNLSAETWGYYPTAFEVDQFAIIKAAAIRQKWIDQGQSTNIFMEIDKASGKYLHEIYTLAWKLGLKSTYYLRSQSADSKKAEEVMDRSIECSGCQ